MFFFRSVILFGLILTALNVFVVLFTIVAIDYTGKNLLSFCILLLGGSYMVSFIITFGQMVISETIATYHWTENKEEISEKTILRCIAIVCR